MKCKIAKLKCRVFNWHNVINLKTWFHDMLSCTGWLCCTRQVRLIQSGIVLCMKTTFHRVFTSSHDIGWIRGAVKKNNSIFKDIVQIGGREVNPISKKSKEIIFWQKLEREGVTKHIVKNRSTLFCMIYYSIWSNQGTFCLFVSTLTLRK